MEAVQFNDRTLDTSRGVAEVNRGTSGGGCFHKAPYLTSSGPAAGSGWPVLPVPMLFKPTPGFPPFWNAHASAMNQQVDSGQAESGW